MNDIPQLGRIASLVLSPIAIWYAIRVVRKFVPASLEIKSPTQPAHNLIHGISIGFSGKLFDNVYWFVTWLAYEFGDASMLLAWGCFINIFFRQLPLIVSARFHLSDDYSKHSEDDCRLNCG